MMNKPPYSIERAQDFEAIDPLPDWVRKRARSTPEPQSLRVRGCTFFLFASDSV
jgi:hypothetical protein